MVPEERFPLQGSSPVETVTVTKHTSAANSSQDSPSALLGVCKLQPESTLHVPGCPALISHTEKALKLKD